MKLLAYLKLSFKIIIKQLPAFVLSYGIYPIIIALVLAYVQKDLFIPSVNEPIFSIIIKDEDNTPQSNNLISFLNSKDMQGVMTIKNLDDENFDYRLKIPKGYEDSLLGKSPATIVVEAKEKSPTTLGNILINIVNKYSEEISQNLLIQKNIEKQPLSSTDKNRLILEINRILSESHTSNPIKNIIYTVRKSLNSFEYYSIAFLNFTFILFLMSIIASDAFEKEIGIYNRIMSTPMTKIQFFNYGFVSSYFQMIVVNAIYVFAYRIMGLSFQGPLLSLLIILLIQSLMITATGNLISTLLGKKHGMPIMQILLIYQMAISNILGPIQNSTTSGILQFLSKIKPDILISNSYKSYLLGGNLSSISNYLLIMLGISFMIYMVNILAIEKKWGVNR